MAKRTLPARGRAKEVRNSATSRTVRQLDEPGVRGRLEAQVLRQFGDRKKRRVQLAVAQVLKRARIKPDTFYKKLDGERPITEANVVRFARAFGVQPVWLATGRGPMGDDWGRLYRDIKKVPPEVRPSGRPLAHPDEHVEDGRVVSRGLVTARWVNQYGEGVDPGTVDPRTGKPRPGRPRKHPPKELFRPGGRYGPRVVRKPRLGRPRKHQEAPVVSEPPMPPPPPSKPEMVEPDEMRQRIWSAGTIAAAADSWDKFFDAELMQREPRLAALTRLLELAEWLERNVPTEDRYRASEAGAAVEALRGGELKWRQARVPRARQRRG